jgi:hypothetical protein
MIELTSVIPNELDFDALLLCSRRRIQYRIAAMPDGSTLLIPILVLVGRSAGSTLRRISARVSHNQGSYGIVLNKDRGG